MNAMIVAAAVTCYAIAGWVTCVETARRYAKRHGIGHLSVRQDGISLGVIAGLFWPATAFGFAVAKTIDGVRYVTYRVAYGKHYNN